MVQYKMLQAAILANLEPHPAAFAPAAAGQHTELLTCSEELLEEVTGLYTSKLPLHHSARDNGQLQHSLVYTAMHGVGHPYVVKVGLKIRASNKGSRRFHSHGEGPSIVGSSLVGSSMDC